MTKRRTEDDFRAEQDAKNKAKGATICALNDERIRATTQSELDRRVADILRLGQRVITDIIAIGEHLIECKRLVGHGGWAAWLEREFAWSEVTALNFVHVFEMSKTKRVLDLSLPITCLYLLASPSTPESARDEILKRAEAGEPIPVAEVKDIIREHKAGDAAEEQAAHAGHNDHVDRDGGDRDRGGRDLDHDGNHADHHVANAERTPTPTISKAARRSIFQLWETGSPEERQFLRDLVIDEHFGAATGADIYDRISANDRKEVISELLDRLTVSGMLAAMSPEFGQELRAKIPTKNKPRKSLNLTPTSSTVSGDDAGKPDDRDNDHPVIPPAKH